jgi:plasmid replication initiation protein
MQNDSKNKNLVVHKDNKIINASYRLSLSEIRLILCCIGQIRSDRGIDEIKSFSISSSEYSEMFGICKKAAYNEMIDAKNKLFDRYINIDISSLPEIVKKEIGVIDGNAKVRWLQLEASYSDGSIRLLFSDVIKHYLAQLGGHYTKYELKYVANLSSAYAVRIYEFLAAEQFMSRKLEISLIDLRERLQLDAKHDLFGNLNSRVIAPAIEQINQHSNLVVKYDSIKTGRKVTGLKFSFTFKKGMEPKREPKSNPLAQVTAAEIKKGAKIGESWDAAKGRIANDKTKTKTKQVKEKQELSSKNSTPAWESAGFKSLMDYNANWAKRAKEALKVT